MKTFGGAIYLPPLVEERLNPAFLVIMQGGLLRAGHSGVGGRNGSIVPPIDLLLALLPSQLRLKAHLPPGVLPSNSIQL